MSKNAINATRNFLVTCITSLMQHRADVRSRVNTVEHVRSIFVDKSYECMLNVKEPLAYITY